MECFAKSNIIHIKQCEHSRSGAEYVYYLDVDFKDGYCFDDLSYSLHGFEIEPFLGRCVIKYLGKCVEAICAGHYHIKELTYTYEGAGGSYGLNITESIWKTFKLYFRGVEITDFKLDLELDSESGTNIVHTLCYLIMLGNNSYVSTKAEKLRNVYPELMEEMYEFMDSSS